MSYSPVISPLPRVDCVFSISVVKPRLSDSSCHLFRQGQTCSVITSLTCHTCLVKGQSLLAEPCVLPCTVMGCSMHYSAAPLLSPLHLTNVNWRPPSPASGLRSIPRNHRTTRVLVFISYNHTVKPVISVDLLLIDEYQSCVTCNI